MKRQDGKNFGRIIQEYSDYSTIAGVLYIFSSSQSNAGRLYWIVWTSLLVGLGSYWSITAYNDWVSNPVITTLSSAAVPVGNLPFPAVIFCSKGIPSTIYLAAFTKTIMDFLEENLNYKFKYSPIENILMNTKRPFGISHGYVIVGNDTELNILNDKFYVNNTNIVELIFKGLKETQTTYDGLTISYAFDFYLQKRTNVFMEALILTFYMLFSPYASDEFQLKVFFDDFLKEDFQQFSQPWYNFLHFGMNKINVSQVFAPLIRQLWYSKLPCFDQVGLTAMEDNDSSFIKNCNWKGVAISCSSIFTMVPTDQGFCCAFNIAKADVMYVDSLFSRTVLSLQDNDRNLSFKSSNLPNWYVQNKEPWSKPGISMGLKVTLDAHTELLDAYSIDSSFDSFQILIQPTGDFPLVSRGGFRLQRGYHNLVALSGTIINADDSLRVISPQSRGCLYPDENPLDLFKTYSQSNCIFECLLKIVQADAMVTLNLTYPCIPWYFPFSGDVTRVCDPWTSNYIESIWNFSNNSCKHCLPDCNVYNYKYSLSQEPLRQCDDLNVGISPLCNFQQTSSSFKPFLWTQEVYDQLNNEKYKSFITNGRSSNRVIGDLFSGTTPPYFANTYNSYNAYTRDIALVSVFFNVPTVWMFTTTASSTWITFVSNVGGLLGLCVGISFVTAIELVWLCFRFFVEGSFIERMKKLVGKINQDSDEVIQNIDILD